MIGLPTHQARGRWVPPTLSTVGAMGTQKGTSGKNLYIFRSSGPCPADERQHYTNSGAAICARTISTDIRPVMPPFADGKMSNNFGPNCDPNRLRTAVFLNCSTLSWTKNKFCQGAMIGLSPFHHTKHGVAASSQLWEPLSQWVLQKGKSGKFLIYPSIQRPTPSTAPPMLYHLLGP